jgi:cation diffusion facilitator CzcD-associated flavoprotein CzcO
MTRQDPSLSRHIEASANGGGSARLPVRDANGRPDGGAPPTSSAYSVREAPLGAPKHIRIITIGAGASGINLIRTLRNTLPAGTFEHVVYEKNKEVGGTWHENRYPGCRCDVPSHNYQFSWRKNLEWSNFFAPAAEIQVYLCRICDDEDMRSVIKTSHTVRGARWDEDEAVWHIEVTDLATGNIIEDKAHFLIDASGILK